MSYSYPVFARCPAPYAPRFSWAKKFTCQKKSHIAARLCGAFTPGIMLQQQAMLQPQQDTFATAGSLSLPVLNIGLPTSASTSLADFFACAGGTNPKWEGMVMAPLKASHYRCELDDGKTDFCGLCVSRNIDAGLPPLTGCGGYQVFAQMDGPWDGNSECNLPQVSNLFNLHTAYPNATFVLPLMPAEKWVDAITDWYPEGRLRGQFSRCNLPLCPEPCVDNNAKFAAFYDSHATAVRRFVAKYPSHKLIEIDMTGDKAVVGPKLAATTGLPAKCWAPDERREAGQTDWPELAEDKTATHRPNLKEAADHIQDAYDQAAAEAANAAKYNAYTGNADGEGNGEIADGDPLPHTAEGPLLCTDMDLNMGIPTRSAFGGLCCTWCTADDVREGAEHSNVGKICCPTKALNTGGDVRPGDPHKPAPTSHRL